MQSAARVGSCLVGVVVLLCSSVGCGGDDAAEGATATPDGGAPDVTSDTGNRDAVSDAAPDAAPDAPPDVGNEAAQPDADQPDVDNPDADPPDAAPPLGCIEGDFQAYFGDLHAHTTYSDGEGIPSDAFDYARNVAGLDVMIVTDHVEQLYLPSPLGRYQKCNEQADVANVPGQFVAACGFEYGTGYSGITSTGHNNVFFSDHLFPALQTDFHAFFDSLVACPACVGQFNHPGDEPSQTWADFALDPQADQRLNLFEFNGGGDTWSLFFQALDAGWHVSPVDNQDNHSADWGTRNNNRSGLFMSVLSRVGLNEAFLARRTFVSHDDTNATIRLMADTKCWMGSILQGVSSSRLQVEAADPDAGDGFARITLFGPGQLSLHEQDCAGASPCTATFDVSVGEPTYVVARALQVDGGELVSAPIWLVP